LDVRRAGELLRRHPAFGPRGVNVNFTEILDIGRIAVRTFEFGVEDETLACGTGCSSAAFVTALREQWPDRYLSGSDPVLVDVRGGETLKVWFIARPADNVIEDVCLETRVRAVYDGVMRPEFLDRP
jgi:diaminopimelate epimerase